METFAQLSAIHAKRLALQVMPGPLENAGSPPDLGAARELIAAALRSGRTVLGSGESRALLRAFHVPVVEAIPADTEGEAADIAEAMGYPVAMKIRAANITHKTDVGGVRLGLADAEAVRRAFGEMTFDFVNDMFEDVTLARTQSAMDEETQLPLIGFELSCKVIY